MNQCKIQATISKCSEGTGHDIRSWDHLQIDIDKLNNESWIRKPRTKKYYLNYPISFDIETSSFEINGQKQVCMYIWQYAIGDNVYIGRAWDEVMRFNKMLSDGLSLNENRRMIVYVHNLSYEFQFMRKYYDWVDIFALAERKLIYACTVTGIEYRCSYILSNKSLDSLGSSLKKPIEKLKGSLDYELIRSSQTPLDNEELQYCIHDVLIVTEYIRELIAQEGSILKIPLTQTGSVRRYCKKMCLYGDGDDKYSRIDSYMRYHKLMERLTLTKHEYFMLKRAFAGGFTHANIFYVDRVLHDVESQDLTSSYPTVCIADLFPMSRGRLVHPETVAEFDKYVHKYCCVFDIRIYNLQNTFLNEAIISKSKCWECINPVVNNGRLESADMIGITITEQDYFMYSKFYTWDNIAVGDMYIYRRGYLPTPVIESILKFYTDKTVLKGLTDADGHELEEYT